MDGIIDKQPDIKVYTAILSQTGTNDPTATVLQNTLGGTVVWTHQGTGVYHGTFIGITMQNTATFVSGNNFSNPTLFYTGTTTDAIIVSGTDGFATPVNGLDRITVELRIYT